MYKTKVIIERFKESGKYLESFETKSKIAVFEKNLLVKEAILNFEFLKNEVFTIEFQDLNS